MASKTNGTSSKLPSVFPSTHRILILGTHKDAKEEWDAFKAEYDCTTLPRMKRSEAIAAIKDLAAKGNKYDAVLVAPYGEEGKFNAELLGPLAGSLHYVGGQGAGYDKHDLKWLDSIGAWYTSTPESVNHFTALSAFTLMLQCIRHTTQAEATIRRGQWREGFPLTPDPRDLVVGIVGMGNIGKYVRNLCQTIGMTVIYNNRKRLPEDEEGGAKYVTFDELLAQSDMITIHCPLSPATEHLFSTKEFAAMKDGSMLINTSRGPVVDEEALVQALKSGKLDRVGLDVFEFEPKVHPYLIESERASLYPHGGYATKRLCRDLELESLKSLREYLTTGYPKTGVNHPVGFF